MNYLFRIIFLAGITALIVACTGPKTPKEVTQAFWQAVIIQDVDDIIRYSTLSDEKKHDGFNKEWTGYKASWGKIIIDGDKASVVSEFVSPANTSKDDRKFITWLVRHNDTWLVDYDRTAVEVGGGALTELFGKLGKLGSDISKQFRASAGNLGDELQRIGRELEKMTDEFSDHVRGNMQRYADELRNSLRELEQSIDGALKDKNSKLSDKERKLLEDVTADVVNSHDRLSEPTPESFAAVSKSIGAAQAKLAEVENTSVDAYRQQWQLLSQQLEEKLENIAAELSSAH